MRDYDRLPESFGKAINDAAIEICEVYDVSTPRGKSYVNPAQVTIAIIIAEQLKGHIFKMVEELDDLHTGFAQSIEARSKGL